MDHKLPLDLVVITPAYNEEACVDLFVDRLVPILESLQNKPNWTVIFVDNGSRDLTHDKLVKLHNSDPRFKVLCLSRNFGYQGALVAGLSELEAACYCCIDIDCEDPPELIAAFWKKSREGYQVIYGVRSNRDERKIITLFRRLFYSLNSFFSDSEAIPWMGEFALITLDVRNALLKYSSNFRFLRTEIAALGFKRIGLDYRRGRRVAGTSHYNFLSAARFAISGILASTTLPLRLAFYSVPFFLLAFFFSLLMFSGTTFLIAGVTLIFVYQIITTSMIALYIARTYKNTLGLSTYIVDRSRSHV